MIDDSPKSKPTYLTEEDANMLASLLMGDVSSGPLVDITDEGDLLLDLTDSPTLTFDPDRGIAAMLSGSNGTRVSDLVDVPLVLGIKPSAAVIARSVFGQPEPGSVVASGSVITLPNSDNVRNTAVVGGAATHGTSQGWFHPTSDGAAAPGGDLFTPTAKRAEPNVTVRLETSAAGGGHDVVVFSAARGAADRRRMVLLAALFLGALLIGGGLVALLSDNSLLDRGTNEDPVVVTTESPVTTATPATVAPTTAAPTTAAPTTAAPTTAAPTTTVPATTTEPPTTAAPTTTAPPTTRAPRTTSRPATTRPPATAPPTTAPPATTAPTVTFAPPTWAEPLE